jgi:hypothetical protein
MGYFERHFIEHEDDGRATKNVVFAVIAVILSIGLHGLLLHYLGDIPFASKSIEEAKKFVKKRYEPAVVELKDMKRPAEISKDVLNADDLDTTGIGIESNIKKLQFESEDSELIPSLLDPDDLNDTTVVAPEELAKPIPWNARQEILKIEDTKATTQLPALERMDILEVYRIEKAPDLTMSISQSELTDVLTGEDSDEFLIAAKPGAINIVAPKPVDAEIEVESKIEELKVESSIDKKAENLYKETRQEITDLKPLEDLLTVNMETFSPRGDDYKYFKLQINRASPDILPELPSDIIIVQDCSASMTEQKLYFCRQAITNWLENVPKQNRINVASFRTEDEMCFDGWKDASSDNIKAAKDFVMQMKADGNTDIYGSIKNLINMPRIPGRPIIVLVISDGYSTTGVTASTSIIGEFTRLNEGRFSVFTLGTIKLANQYLLEQLAYCNRGSSTIVTKGRWDIPIEIQNILESVKRPVLVDIKLIFPENSGVEVYPSMTENLYLDRELVVYGRYPKDKEKLVFQAVGDSIDKSCDMVFDIPFEIALAGKDKTIEEIWAKQKIYSLLGEYAKKPSVDIMNQINDTARIYNVKLPYRGRL